jgi:predicted acyltransferase (DUF342 family)
MLAPDATHCITTVVASPVGPANTACAPVNESLGNGGSYTYWVGPVLGVSGICAGLPIVTGTVVQRCVTSQGSVNGVLRRVQVREAAYAAAPVFPIAGLTGLHSVTLSNNALVTGGEASNGQITLSNNALVTTTTLGPSAPNVSLGNNASAGVVTRRTQAQGPFVLSPVNPGNSATVNDDQRIVNALASPPGTPADSVSGNVSYSAATRSLNLSNNASITLGGAIYNFCTLTLYNNGTLTIAAGARTAIYIDSPDRPGSGCPTGSGTLSVSNNSSIINNSPPPQGSGLLHDTTALQLYVYGRNDGSNVVTFSNNTDFYGTLYAPQSTINLSNNGTMYGSVAGNNVSLSPNGRFVSDASDLTIATGAAGIYFRTAWRECQPQATTSDPQSGC